MRGKVAWGWLMALGLATLVGAEDVQHRLVRVDNRKSQLVHVDQRRPEGSCLVTDTFWAQFLQTFADKGFRGRRTLINNAGNVSTVEDRLVPIDVHRVRLGGEIGRRLEITLQNNLHKID